MIRTEPASLPRGLERTVDYIARIQRDDGAIAWFDGGIVDPWDHVEAAMGLAIGGRLAAARRAYRWLGARQQPDGSWLAAYQDDTVVDATRSETNFVAYVATGVWHYQLVSGDTEFSRECWPMVERAIEFVLSLQATSGEIWWARDTRTGTSHDALVTGCSSIYKSLESALLLAALLGHDRPLWYQSRERLGVALRERPERFDRTWESKRRYSMDWFYPVLCGVLTGNAARAHIERHWDRFVVDGHGCRCVADRPWVTVAESCELVMALLAIRDRVRAARVFDWLAVHRAEDGSWWTGYEFVERVYWPRERPTWTAGAVLLAADALHGLTPAASLFGGTAAHASVQSAT